LVGSHVGGGEDIEFIARRLVILAAEDIGLANPNALLMANTCFQAIRVVGMPESRIILSEAVIYLATSPKSNSAYLAIGEAQELVRQTGNLPVPLHLRNAPTKLMKSLDYGKGYKYAHDYKGNFAEQEFFPKEIEKTKFLNLSRIQQKKKSVKSYEMIGEIGISIKRALGFRLSALGKGKIFFRFDLLANSRLVSS
jgi:putative ATPase